MRSAGLRLHIPYPLLLALLFAFGINVPQLSQVVVYILVLPLIANWNGSVKRDFLVPLCLLGAFGTVYYMVLYAWGFIELTQAVHRPIMFMGFYAVGYRATRTDTPSWPYGLTWPLLAVVSGFVVFAVLSTIVTPLLMTITVRAVNNFWGTGETILDTGVGLFASLGLCLLPVVIFGAVSRTRGPDYLVRTFVAAALFALAFYATTLFQNRSALVALAFAVCTSFAIFLSTRNSRRTSKVLALLLVVVATIVVALNIERVLAAPILERLSDRGLQTPRYTAWMTVIASLPSHLLGGRAIYLGDVGFAHNIWLDVAYDAGIVPLLCLLSFHALHVRDFYRIATSRLPLPVIVLFVCLAISFLGGFMAEPVLQSSAPYFAGSCYLFGMARRLSWDIGHPEPVRLQHPYPSAVTAEA